MGGETATLTLEDFWLRYGAVPPDSPPVPPQAEHVFLWFRDLSARRAQGFDGPQPISYADIDVWSRLTRTAIRPEEVRLLTSMDDAYLAELSRVRELARQEKDSGNGRSGS